MEQVQLTSVDGVLLDAAVHRAADPRGTVVQLHGITVDLDEGGMFVRLADQLAGSGFAVLRFSFRGHGNSGGTQRGMTIAGELLDLQAAVEYAAEHLPGPLTIIGSSFGAVSTALSLPWLGTRLVRLVLWNPVLDLRRTFVEPELPWGLENFSPVQQELLGTQGFLKIDDGFEAGRVLFEEFERYRPLDNLLASSVPTLVVHGDQDSAVSYDIAKNAAAQKPNTEIHTVLGSDHGFDSREREDEAIAVTVDWLTGPRR
ncbi:alpha/beta fold hydrolase [Pseudonocardiaceae bacterium YIM PH 21723]|nr:alpha/beta fold hydrolase [Pseudonocardiaceae bacterium YIM PH 21723]